MDDEDDMEHDAEIYDDNDLFSLHLRDLVEAGVGSTEADTSDAAAFAKLMMRQQRKLIKKRRKVDTKASKGRKLR